MGPVEDRRQMTVNINSPTTQDYELTQMSALAKFVRN